MSVKISHPSLACPPYAAAGSGTCCYVVNADGINCLAFTEKPGAKFCSWSTAVEIARTWNADVYGKDQKMTYRTCPECGCRFDPSLRWREDCAAPINCKDYRTAKQRARQILPAARTCMVQKALRKYNAQIAENITKNNFLLQRLMGTSAHGKDQ